MSRLHEALVLPGRLPLRSLLLAVQVAVVALLIAAGLAATVYPARRATRIDPINALRCE